MTCVLYSVDIPSGGGDEDHSWADLAALPAQPQMKPNTSMMTRPLSSGPGRKYGTKKVTPPAAEDAKQLTCVPRRVVTYVERLHKRTTEDDLMDFLSGVKLSNLSAMSHLRFCRAIVSRDSDARQSRSLRLHSRTLRL